MYIYKLPERKEEACNMLMYLKPSKRATRQTRIVINDDVIGQDHARNQARYRSRASDPRRTRVIEGHPCSRAIIEGKREREREGEKERKGNASNG